MIVRDIVERPVAGPSAPRPPQPPSSSSKGFPAPKRRTDATRRQPRGQSSNVEDATVAGPSSRATTDLETRSHDRLSEIEKVRIEVGAENAARVVNMTDEEREGEIAELAERFGGGLLEAIKKRAMARTRAMPTKDEPPDPPPSAVRTRHNPPDPDEMKSTYFSDIPAEPEKLEWMLPLPSAPSDTSIPRFDLNGQRLTAEAQLDLPTHLGLHHHGDAPDLAGYTIEEILHLARSTVVAQRVIMLDVLAKVISTYAADEDQPRDEGVRKVIKEAKVLDQALLISLDIVRIGKSVNLIRAAVEVLYATLGGETWTMLDDTSPIEQFIPESLADRPPISSLDLENLIPRLDELLSSSDYLPPRSVYLLIRILRRATIASHSYAEEVCRLVPHVVSSQVGAPFSTSPRPSLEVLRLVRDVIAASRRCAEALNLVGIAAGLLRFLLPSSFQPEDPANVTAESLDLAVEVLHILGNFGRYGMGARYAVSAIDIFRNLGSAVIDLSKHSGTHSEAALTESFFDLLGIWTACAMDPHKTTPEHDLTWSPISPMGWGALALESAVTLLNRECLGSELEAALGMLAQWLIGIKINEPHRSVEEQQKIRMGLGGAEIRKKLLDALPPFDEAPSADIRLSGTFAAATRIHNLCPMPTDGGLLLGRPPLLARMSAIATLPSPLSGVGSNAVLEYEIQQAAETQERMVSRDWTTPTRQLVRALRLMTLFKQGEEAMALDILDDILRTDWSRTESNLSHLVGEIGHSDGLDLLRPLLQYAILPSLEHLVAPKIASPQYLKVSTTLLRTPPHPPALGKGLPLSCSWLFSPIDELLRSADSPALAQGPPDWNPTELDIVRATLSLASLASKASPRCLDAGEMILGGMKVYMLEHATSTKGVSGGEVEVFRDPVVAKLLEETIKSCSETNTNSTSLETIEDIAKATLHDVPFFQFYTDLLALFEGISFGDPTFAAYLLPPLSMRYPSDFRKLLWVDHPTALRLLRTALSSLPVEHRLEDYFEPPEDNAEILRGYARALSRGWVGPSQGALEAIAIHHVASCLWNYPADETERWKDVRKSLLVTVLGQDAVLKNPLEYNVTTRSGTVSEEEKARRKEIAKGLVGDAGAMRIDAI